MSILKKHGPAIVQGVWLAALVGFTCAVSSCNNGKLAQSYDRVHDRISEVNSKIDALAETSNLKFVPKPIRPEREGRDL